MATFTGDSFTYPYEIPQFASPQYSIEQLLNYANMGNYMDSIGDGGWFSDTGSFGGGISNQLANYVVNEIKNGTPLDQIQFLEGHDLTELLSESAGGPQNQFAQAVEGKLQNVVSDLQGQGITLDYINDNYPMISQLGTMDGSGNFQLGSTPDQTTTAPPATTTPVTTTPPASNPLDPTNAVATPDSETPYLGQGGINLTPGASDIGSQNALVDPLSSVYTSPTSGLPGDKVAATVSAPWSGLSPYLGDMYSYMAGTRQMADQLGVPDVTMAGFNPYMAQTNILGEQAAGDIAELTDRFGGTLDSITGSQNPLLSTLPHQQATDRLSSIMSGEFGDSAYSQPFSNLPDNEYTNALSSAAQPGTNPYLSQMTQKAMGDVTDVFNRDVMGNIRDEFELAGQYGSSEHQQAVSGAAETLQDTLGDISSSMYGRAYDADMTRALQAGTSGLGMQLEGGRQGMAGQELYNQLQLGAAGKTIDPFQEAYSGNVGDITRGASLMPQMAGMYQMPQSIMANMGSNMMNWDQSVIDDQINRYMWDYNMANQANLNYGQGLGYGNVPGSSATWSDNPSETSWADAIAGGAMGYAMGGPWGAAAMSLPYLEDLL